MNFTLHVEMTSDWHVGSGFGRPGSVDRLVARDADDLPFVPAKTVRGMWRDAAERLARGLDDGAERGPWQRLVVDVFGSQPQLGDDDPGGYHTDKTRPPRETVLRVTPARLPDALRNGLRGRSPERAALRAAATFVKPGVAIEPTSGRAKDDHLRFEEMGRAGTVLTATATFAPDPATGPRVEAARSLMLAATRLIERIGGKRRRGAGKCRVTVAGADVAAAVIYLGANRECPDGVKLVEPRTDPDGGSTRTNETTRPASKGWVVFPLTITLQGPVAVPARTVGNVVESLDFVPGTYFLPHVTRVFRQGGWDAGPAIARGDVRVSNATIEVDRGAGQPTPLHLFAPKGKGYEEAVNGFRHDPDGRKQIRGNYVGTAAGRTVPEHVGTHNVIEDGPQRPTERVGGIYSFEAIAPTDGTGPVVLRAEVRVRKHLLPAKITASSFDGDVRLGVSKKDDYGDAHVRAGSVSAAPPAAVPGKELFVWLLSDVLLRDDSLRPDPTIGGLERELARKLGVKLTHDKWFARSRRTESWHTGWGLPRPSLVGLQAGSCVRFEVDGTIPADRLTAVEADGLGERTAEGYGQVRFNDPLLTAEAPSLAAWTPPEETESRPPTGDAAAFERAAWRESIRVAALAATATPEQRKSLFGWDAGRPNASPLGGLRAAVAFLRSKADRGRVTGWLGAVAKNPRRAEKWPPGALNAVTEFAASDRAVWTVLTAVDAVVWPTTGGGRPGELEAELWADAVRAVVGAAIHAHKRASEQGGLTNGT